MPISKLSTNGTSYQDPPQTRNSSLPEAFTNEDGLGQASVVRTERGFFTEGPGSVPDPETGETNINSEEVILAGGVNGKVVTLTTGSVFDLTSFNSRAAIKAAQAQNYQSSINLDEQNIRKSRTNFDAKARASTNSESITLAINKDQIRYKSLTVSLDSKTKDNVLQESEINVNSIINRNLQNLSYLIFIDEDTKIVVPFFENPKIEEKRLASYNIIHGPGGQIPIISYNYTDYSNIKVTFTLDPLNMAHILSKETCEHLVINNQTPITITNYLKSKKEVLKDCITKYKELNKLDKNNIDNFINDTPYGKAQVFCLFWIYVIKNAIFYRRGTNSQVTPMQFFEKMITLLRQNKPIGKRVILNHGPVFYNIPCYLFNYEIKEVANTPYHVESRMANRYEITLTLWGTPESAKEFADKAGVPSEGNPMSQGKEAKQDTPDTTTQPPTVTEIQGRINSNNQGN